MMKVVEIVNNTVWAEYPMYSDAQEARRNYAPTLQFEDAPDNIRIGFGFDPTKKGDERFIRPLLNDGWVYDEDNYPWNPEEQRELERKEMHDNTTSDTMQALRKIREGDTSIDWSKWLDMLDAYNLAIEDTKNQKDYPLKVIYPEYPTKPTK